MTTKLPSREESFAQYVNRMSIRLAIAAGVVIALAVASLNTDRSLIPLSGEWRAFGDITFFALFPVAAITSAAGFLLGLRAWNGRVGPARQRRWWWAALPVALAYMGVAGGISILAISAVEFAFRDLQLSLLQSAVVAGSASAALIFSVVGDAMRLNTQRLLTLAVVVLASGIYISSVYISDPFWWRISFSYEGKSSSNVHLLFDTTLIFAGILILIWNRYFMSDYRILLRHGIADARSARLVHYGLLWVGIAIMIVGTFKSKESVFGNFMHNLAAYSLAVVLLLFMASIRWIVPGFPPEFRALSTTILAILVGMLVWAVFGGVNVVGREVTVFSLGLMWLSQFARNTHNLAIEQEPDISPE